mmetsp:Transcript_5377/g.14702  ORF Transcript_5377/g.14702 Transcript_5377/m.14702 type:complete len:220 (-) Transcript_5377:1-660(-)
MAFGPPRTNFATISSTFASMAVGAETWLIKPTCTARSADIFSPDSINSAASARRIFGRHTAEMMAGATPMRTSVKPNWHSLLITEMSQAAATPTPPPVQWPRILPTITFVLSCMSFRMSTKVYFGASFEPFRLAPAQKVFPSLVSTTARTTSSADAAFKWSPRELTNSPLSAFFCSGLFKTMVATPPATWSVVAGAITTAIRTPGRCAHGGKWARAAWG